MKLLATPAKGLRSGRRTTWAKGPGAKRTSGNPSPLDAKPFGPICVAIPHPRAQQGAPNANFEKDWFNGVACNLVSLVPNQKYSSVSINLALAMFFFLQTNKFLLFVL